MTSPFHRPATRLALPLRAAAVTAGVVVGIIAWQHEFTQGMATTGVRDIIPWGAYTVAFLVFVAVAAGALALGCVAVLAPSSPLSQLGSTALMTAIAGLVAAVAAYVVNLGRPARIYDLFLHPNWSSPLVWSLYAVLIALAVAAALLMVRRRLSHTVSVAGRALSLIGIAAAAVAAGATASIFTVQSGRAAWSGLVIPLFMMSAALAGPATVTLIARAGRVISFATRHRATRDWIRRLIVAALLVELVLTAIGYLSASRGNSQRWAAMQVVLPGGAWSWLFWTQWLGGGLVPLALLVTPLWRRRRGVIDAALGLSVLGVVASYIALVPGYLASPDITLSPGMAVGVGIPGSASFRVIGAYRPTWTAYGVLLGLVCIFFAVLALTNEHSRLAVEAG